MKIPATLADLPRPLYFFDGYCVLCSGFVAFCIKRDPERRLKFASAQSPLGARMLQALGLPPATLDRTIVLLDGDEAYLESTAVLRSLRYLDGPVRLLRILFVVPALLRDPLYRVIARNRYRLFGRRDSCFVPTAEDRQRFVDL